MATRAGKGHQRMMVTPKSIELMARLVLHGAA
jgi:hypothetical protein